MLSAAGRGIMAPANTAIAASLMRKRLSAQCDAGSTRRRRRPPSRILASIIAGRGDSPMDRPIRRTRSFLRADQWPRPPGILRHDDDEAVDVEPKRRRRRVAAAPRIGDGVFDIGEAGSRLTIGSDDRPTAESLAGEASDGEGHGRHIPLRMYSTSGGDGT